MAKEARRRAAYSRLVGDNGLFKKRERERKKERKRNTKPLDYCKKMSDSLQHRLSIYDNTFSKIEKYGPQ
jgi:hypothetical protein